MARKGKDQRVDPRRLGPSKLMAEQRCDLLEVPDDRYDSRSTIVTSQLPLDK